MYSGNPTRFDLVAYRFATTGQHALHEPAPARAIMPPLDPSPDHCVPQFLFHGVVRRLNPFVPRDRPQPPPPGEDLETRRRRLCKYLCPPKSLPDRSTQLLHPLLEPNSWQSSVAHPGTARKPPVGMPRCRRSSRGRQDTSGDEADIGRRSARSWEFGDLVDHGFGIVTREFKTTTATNRRLALNCLTKLLGRNQRAMCLAMSVPAPRFFHRAGVEVSALP